MSTKGISPAAATTLISLFINIALVSCGYSPNICLQLTEYKNQPFPLPSPSHAANEEGVLRCLDETKDLSATKNLTPSENLLIRGSLQVAENCGNNNQKNLGTPNVDIWLSSKLSVEDTTNSLRPATNVISLNCSGHVKSDDKGNFQIKATIPESPSKLEVRSIRLLLEFCINEKGAEAGKGLKAKTMLVIEGENPEEETKRQAEVTDNSIIIRPFAPNGQYIININLVMKVQDKSRDDGKVNGKTADVGSDEINARPRRQAVPQDGIYANPLSSKSNWLMHEGIQWLSKRLKWRHGDIEWLKKKRLQGLDGNDQDVDWSREKRPRHRLWSNAHAEWLKRKKRHIWNTDYIQWVKRRMGDEEELMEEERDIGQEQVHKTAEAPDDDLTRAGDQGEGQSSAEEQKRASWKVTGGAKYVRKRDEGIMMQ